MTDSLTLTLLNTTEDGGSSNCTADNTMSTMWIICESTSAALTLLSFYITGVLFLYMRQQNVGRMARQRMNNSVFATPRPSSFDNLQQSVNFKRTKVTDACINAGRKRAPYLEQTSVESTRSHSNLIHSTSVELQECSANVVSTHRIRERADRGAWLLRAIVTCAVVVTMRCVVEQCLILMGHLPDPVCSYLTKAMIALTALSLHCCHVFLWIRQLTFYSNPFLKPLRSGKLRALSYAAYAVMPVTLAAVLTLFMAWRDYESVDGVCMPSTVNLSTYLPFGVLVASTVTIQVLLSALFLYPLLMHRRKRMMHGGNNRKDSASSTSSATTSKKKDKLMGCIKRVFRGATVGITTDVFGGILSMFFPADMPMFAYSVLYNLNVWLNVFCLIYTYANWRRMIFPWCCLARRPRRFEGFRRSSTPIRRTALQTSFRSTNNKSNRPASMYV